MEYTKAFQSTLPVRGATSHRLYIYRQIIFQSTLPVRGATSPAFVASIIRSDFNPRSP